MFKLECLLPAEAAQCFTYIQATLPEPVRPHEQRALAKQKQRKAKGCEVEQKKKKKKGQAKQHSGKRQRRTALASEDASRVVALPAGSAKRPGESPKEARPAGKASPTACTIFEEGKACCQVHPHATRPAAKARSKACPVKPIATPSRRRVKCGTEWVDRHREDLACLPAACHPASDVHGKHSWVLRAANGASVEVLLTRHAFFLKKRADGEPFPESVRKHVSWAKFETVQDAWAHACEVTGFPL